MQQRWGGDGAAMEQRWSSDAAAMGQRRSSDDTVEPSPMTSTQGELQIGEVCGKVAMLTGTGLRHIP
jgi:hypothetical protein